MIDKTCRMCSMQVMNPVERVHPVEYVHSYHVLFFVAPKSLLLRSN